jgi:hypothetical protein
MTIGPGDIHDRLGQVIQRLMALEARVNEIAPVKKEEKPVATPQASTAEDEEDEPRRGRRR